MDAPKDKEDLMQAWHMQRALLEKQNIEIARLKKKDKLYAKHKRLLNESNRYFLEEIKRLRGLVKDAYHEGYWELLPNEPWEFSQVKKELKVR